MGMMSKEEAQNQDDIMHPEKVIAREEADSKL